MSLNELKVEQVLLFLMKVESPESLFPDKIQFLVHGLGCKLEIRVSDLPEIGKTRLLAALKKPPEGTFVISESKLKWALTGLAVGLLGLWGLVAAADNYKWQPDDRLGHLILTIGCFVIGGHSVAYLFSWFRSEFKPQVLINPLYFLRFRFNLIEAIPFTEKRFGPSNT